MIFISFIKYINFFTLHYNNIEAKKLKIKWLIKCEELEFS